MEETSTIKAALARLGSQRAAVDAGLSRPVAMPP